MPALCTCCFVTFQAMSSTEISQNVGTPPENLANDEDHLSGSEGTPAIEAPAPEPQPKPAAKRKPKPKPKGKADINLADYLTYTKRLRVRWDQILIDRDCSKGQVRGLNPDRLQARYDDSLRAPPPDCIDDLLLIPGVRMFCPILFRFYSIFGAIRFYSVLPVTPCTAGFWYVIGGQHIYTAAMQHRNEKEAKNHPLLTWTREFEGFEVRRDTPLLTRRKLAGLHQLQTTSSLVSTASQRMALLLEHIAEDGDAPLLTHTQNMLAEIGITGDEGNVVCSTFRLYPLYLTVGLYFYLSLAV